MDLTRYMVLNKNGQDITDICIYNQETGFYDVTYHTGKTYNYKKSSLTILTEPEIIPAENKIVFLHGRIRSEVDKLYLFTEGTVKHWRIAFKNRKTITCRGDEIRIAQSCIGEKAVREKLQYLKELAQSNELMTEDGQQLLSLQYDKLNEIEATSALAVYLEPDKYANQTFEFNDFIYPFGVNASQIKAVQNALRNQVSVIQGPPGTGKTQTILNIIANLLVQNKTVQVVSNNNSAIENVLEKLSDDSYNLSFLAALLGKMRIAIVL